VAHAVLGGQLGAALAERLLLSREPGAAGCQYTGATGELVEFQQPGLVGVEQASALALFGLDGCVQAFELRGHQLVLVGRPGQHSALGGQELVWGK
jgi:hypothetical protein